MVIVKPAPSLRTPPSSLSLRSSRRLHPYRRPLAEEEDENIPYRPRYYEDDDLLYLVLAAERRRVLQEERDAVEDREENAEDGAMAIRALVALYIFLLLTMLFRQLLMLGLLYRIVSGNV